MRTERWAIQLDRRGKCPCSPPQGRSLTFHDLEAPFSWSGSTLPAPPQHCFGGLYRHETRYASSRSTLCFESKYTLLQVEVQSASDWSTIRLSHPRMIPTVQQRKETFAPVPPPPYSPILRSRTLGRKNYYVPTEIDDRWTPLLFQLNREIPRCIIRWNHGSS